MNGIRVTATDLDHPEETPTVEIMNNYLLITAGTCEQTYVQVSTAKDGQGRPRTAKDGQGRHRDARHHGEGLPSMTNSNVRGSSHDLCTACVA